MVRFVQIIKDRYKGLYRIPTARLKNWDYASGGYYFITICVKNRECCLGKIINRQMNLSEFGNVVKDCWYDLTKHYKNIILDKFIVMPNHVHGIIIIKSVETGFKPVSTKKYSLSEIIRGFKTFSARKINLLKKCINQSFWQSRFYDHIIRNEKSFLRIKQYIVDNPKNWSEDKNNTENLFM